MKLPIQGRPVPACHMAVRTITMYAKSFLACNSAGRLTGARTALGSPDERYTCHYCGSVLVLHADAERPWFAHTDAALTERGRQDCPYIHPDVDEVLLIRQLQRYVPNAMSVMGHVVYHNPIYGYHKDEEAWLPSRCAVGFYPH